MGDVKGHQSGQRGGFAAQRWTDSRDVSGIREEGFLPSLTSEWSQDAFPDPAGYSSFALRSTQHLLSALGAWPVWATPRTSRASGFLLGLANGRYQPEIRGRKKREIGAFYLCSLLASAPHLPVHKTTGPLG